MGDRANVAIKTDRDGPPIVLYTHWNGHELPDAVTAALITARRRWDDEQYFGRIMVHKTLTALGADPDGETGFGLTVGSIGDNSYPILFVDPFTQTVTIANDQLVPDESRAIPFEDATKDGALRSLRGK